MYDYDKKRTFTKEEKLLILKEVEQEGVKSTLEKHGIYPATYYSWKKKFEQMGEAGFQHGMTPTHIKEIKRLGKEQVLEMDIKYVWVTQARRHSYILTIIDTFTRFVLHGFIANLTPNYSGNYGMKRKYQVRY